VSRVLAALLALVLAAPVRAAGPRVAFRVDPRFELLGVLQTLAGGGLASGPARDAIFARYGRWKEHPAVADLRAIEAKNGRRDPLALIALFLSAPPELQWTAERRDLPDMFVDAAGGGDALARFLDDARAFARDSDFSADFDARAEERRRAEAAARAPLGGRDPLVLLDDYVGRPLDARLEVILCGVFDPGEQNSFVIPYPSLEHGPVRGPLRVYTILTPTTGGNWGISAPSLSRLWNEPLYASLIADLDRFDARLAAAKTDRLAADGGCPPSPAACGKHLIVMAIARRLDARLFGSAAEEPAPRSCADRAVAALEEVLRAGRERGRPPRVADALPALVARLETPLCGNP